MGRTLEKSDHISGSNPRRAPSGPRASVLCGCLIAVLLAWHLGGSGETKAPHSVPPDIASERSPDSDHLATCRSFLIARSLPEWLSDADPEDAKAGCPESASRPLGPRHEGSACGPGLADRFACAILFLAPKIGPPARTLP